MQSSSDNLDELSVSDGEDRYDHDESLASVDEKRRTASHKLVLDSDLRQLNAFCAIKGITGKTLKCYERIDGSPLVPGVDWNKITSETNSRWYKYCHGPLRNAKKGVESRRQKLFSEVPTDTNYLPLDYNPNLFIRPRSGYRPPLTWTAKDYHSQFRRPPISDMKCSPELLDIMSNFSSRPSLVLPSFSASIQNLASLLPSIMSRPPYLRQDNPTSVLAPSDSFYTR